MPGPTKLTITACDVANESISELGDPPAFQAMLNPSDYSITTPLTYSVPKAQGSPSKSPKYKRAVPEKIKIGNLTLDGTGVVPDAPKKSVDDQIAALRAVVSKFDGTQHECRVVKIVWGSFLQYGRLTSIEVKYTMFSAYGLPLRAEVVLEFIQFQTVKESMAEAKLSSPDLTHRIETRAGDTLALLCQRVYRSQSHVQEVARANDLDSTRILPAGTTLFFPPLRD